MLSRPARWRFAFLALLATMLLVVMPTLAQLRASAGGDARTHVVQHAMAGMAGHDAAPAAREGHDGHDGTCRYCPLLAGLLHWNATPALTPYAGAARFVSNLRAHPPYARTWPGTLGSRGPPASRNA